MRELAAVLATLTGRAWHEDGAELAALVSAADADGDGAVDLAEFFGLLIGSEATLRELVESAQEALGGGGSSSSSEQGEDDEDEQKEVGEGEQEEGGGQEVAVVEAGGGEEGDDGREEGDDGDSGGSSEAGSSSSSSSDDEAAADSCLDGVWTVHFDNKSSALIGVEGGEFELCDEGFSVHKRPASEGGGVELRWYGDAEWPGSVLRVASEQGEDVEWEFAGEEGCTVATEQSEPLAADGAYGGRKTVTFSVTGGGGGGGGERSPTTMVWTAYRFKSPRFDYQGSFGSEEDYVAYLRGEAGLKPGMRVRAFTGSREGDIGTFKTDDGSSCPLFRWDNYHDTYFTQLSDVEILDIDTPKDSAHEGDGAAAAATAAAAALAEGKMFTATVPDDDDYELRLDLRDAARAALVIRELDSGHVAHDFTDGGGVDGGALAAMLRAHGKVARIRLARDRVIIYLDEGEGKPGTRMEIGMEGEEDEGMKYLNPSEQTFEVPKCPNGHQMVASCFHGDVATASGSGTCGSECARCGEEESEDEDDESGAERERWVCVECQIVACYDCFPAKPPPMTADGDTALTVSADDNELPPLYHSCHCPHQAITATFMDPDGDDHGLKEETGFQRGFGCDACNRAIATDKTKHGCMKCNFDLCEECHSDLGKAAAAKLNFMSTRHQCPEADNDLAHFMTSSSGFECDGCRASQPADTGMFSCRDCDFDLCRQCFMSDERRTSAIDRYQEDHISESESEESDEDEGEDEETQDILITEAESDTFAGDPNKAWGGSKDKNDQKRKGWEDVDNDKRPKQGDLVWIVNGSWTQRRDREVIKGLEDLCSGEGEKRYEAMTSPEKLGLVRIMRDDKDSMPYTLSSGSGYYKPQQLLKYDSSREPKKDTQDGFIIVYQVRREGCVVAAPPHICFACAST